MLSHKVTIKGALKATIENLIASTIKRLPHNF